MIGQRTGRRFGQFRRVPGQFTGLGQRFLPRKPVLMPARFPFGHILLAELASAKVLSQDLFRFRQRIQLLDEADARLAVRNPAVELIAEARGSRAIFPVWVIDTDYTNRHGFRSAAVSERPAAAATKLLIARKARKATQSSEAMISLTLIRLMRKRLANATL